MTNPPRSGGDAAPLDLEMVKALWEHAKDEDYPHVALVSSRYFQAVLDALTLARQQVQQLQAVVNKQAEDDGLWFIATRASEAYLQQELRALHRAVESATAAIGGLVD